MNYDLPKSLEVCGEQYKIRYDYRAALDILSALESKDLSNEEKAIVALTILYPDFEEMPTSHYEEALKKCYWYMDGGSSEEMAQQKSPRLVNWEQDFRHIVAPINRVIGTDVRGIEYDEETNTGGLHWWTFLSAYMEIGDCTFAQIVRIRDLKARGKPLDKQDKEWYRRNRHLVDMKREYTEDQKEFFKNW